MRRTKPLSRAVKDSIKTARTRIRKWQRRCYEKQDFDGCEDVEE